MDERNACECVECGADVPVGGRLRKRGSVRDNKIYAEMQEKLSSDPDCAQQENKAVLKKLRGIFSDSSTEE